MQQVKKYEKCVIIDLCFWLIVTKNENKYIQQNLVCLEDLKFDFSLNFFTTSIWWQMFFYLKFW